MKRHWRLEIGDWGLVIGDWGLGKKKPILHWQGSFCLRFAHAMPNPLRVAIKMPLARQRHSERYDVECRVIEEVTSSRERGHLARFGACGDDYGAARPDRPN